jgi:hypothetical protein
MKVVPYKLTRLRQRHKDCTTQIRELHEYLRELPADAPIMVVVSTASQICGLSETRSRLCEQIDDAETLIAQYEQEITI